MALWGFRRGLLFGLILVGASMTTCLVVWCLELCLLCSSRFQKETNWCCALPPHHFVAIILPSQLFCEGTGVERIKPPLASDSSAPSSTCLALFVCCRVYMALSCLSQELLRRLELIPTDWGRTGTLPSPLRLPSFWFRLRDNLRPLGLFSGWFAPWLMSLLQVPAAR